jgi:chromate transporter
MVVQFVAFLGAYRNPGTLSPISAALLGSLLTTWVTFVPCFYWIFLGAPYVERLRSHRGWAAALTMITAAVVGVILNLAVWFAVHTLFGQIHQSTWGPLHLEWPAPASLNLRVLLVAAVAFLLTFRFRASMPLTLATCCGLGLLLT